MEKHIKKNWFWFLFLFISRCGVLCVRRAHLQPPLISNFTYRVLVCLHFNTHSLFVRVHACVLSVRLISIYLCYIQVYFSCVLMYVFEVLKIKNVHANTKIITKSISLSLIFPQGASAILLCVMCACKETKTRRIRLAAWSTPRESRDMEWIITLYMFHM